MRFDVVVVGGGLSGGLSAAAYLQKAGLKVAIVERRHELATFAPTTEPWPGVLMSPHASINWSGPSPVMEDLELEKYGYRLVFSPTAYGTTHKDGKNLLVYHDPSMTAKAFKRFSEKDAKVVEKLQTGLMQDVTELVETLFYKAPETHPAEVMECAMGLGRYVGIDPEAFSKMTAIQLVEELFESDHVRRTMFMGAALNVVGSALAKGQGAFTVICGFLALLPIGSTVGGMHTLAHALSSCFVEHGGAILRNCPVDRIIIRDGEAVGVHLSEEAVYPGQTIYADKALISDVGAIVTLELLGEDVMRSIDAELATKMKYWKTDYRGSVVSNWVMKDRPTWKSEAWNPDIEKAFMFYRAWDSWQECKDWVVAMQNGDFRGALGLTGELVDFGSIDPMGRSPEGFVVVRNEEAVPFEIRSEGGPSRWDDLRDEIMEKRSEVMEALAPGFRDKMLQHLLYTPLDLWRYNPSGVSGQVLGGDFSEDQWILDRMPYRMPIKKLYMAAGVWPLALSLMATGYNCACLVAEDLGVRDQSWWVHRPVDWLLRNLPSLIVA
ncbi:MAG: phytoene desaturase family protein [Anaerolineae bacterium]